MNGDVTRIGTGQPLEVISREAISERLRDKRLMDLAVGDGWRTIVCDVDEVVVPIVPKWVALASQAGIIEEMRDFEKVINRKTYEIADWLEIPEDRREEFQALYGEDFYAGLPPTRMAQGLKMLSGKGSTRLVFITHTVEINRESKEGWLRRQFPQATIIHVPLGGSKSAAIRENIPEYSTFVDDRPDLLGHAVMHTTSFGKEFIMPAFGYNEDIGLVLRKAVELGLVEVSRYHHTY